MNTRITLICALALSACGRSVAPTSLELGELMLETFRDARFTNANEERDLQARLLQLTSEVSEMADKAFNDGRAVAPPILTPEYLDGIAEPLNEDGEPTDFEAQTPEAVAYRSDFPFSDFEALFVDPNQNCLGSNSTKFSDRRTETDMSCFNDGTCDRFTYESSNRTENILASVWIETFGDFYRTTLDLGAEEVDAVVGRNWIEETWLGDGGNARWRQRYVLDFWVPDPDDTSKTLRLYVMWSEARIPAVGDTLYRTRVREGIEESFNNTDSFLDGNICADRDKTRDDWG